MKCSPGPLEGAFDVGGIVLCNTAPFGGLFFGCASGYFADMLDELVGICDGGGTAVSLDAIIKVKFVLGGVIVISS